jgi:hypothetical protein
MCIRLICIFSGLYELQTERIKAGSSRPCFFFEMSIYCVCHLGGETFDFCYDCGLLKTRNFQVFQM